MKLTDTILTAMSQYPSLFQRPEQVLDHLYLTLGGGFTWQNGQLAYETNGTKPEKPINKVFVPWDEEVETFRVEHTENIDSFYVKLLKEIDFVRPRPFTTEKAIYRLIYGRIQPLITYPIYKNYSHCCSVPIDADPDWVAGAYMILNYILDNTRFNNKALMLSLEYTGEFFTKHKKPSPDYITKRKNHLGSQRAEAKIAKDKLDAQFNKTYWKEAYAELKAFVKKVEDHKQLTKFHAEWEIDIKKKDARSSLEENLDENVMSINEGKKCLR